MLSESIRKSIDFLRGPNPLDAGIRKALLEVVEYATSQYPDFIYLPCDWYHVEYGKPHCWGTKEKEVCNCGGDKNKCNFYSL